MTDEKRRGLITGAAGAAVALATLAAVPGCASVTSAAPPAEKKGDDPALLDNLIGLENQAIAAYEQVLAGPLLDDNERALATTFLADHRRHAQVLTHAAERLSDPRHKKPIGAAPPFPEPTLAQTSDALQFLATLEQGLTLAYLGAVPAFAGRDLAKASAGILGVESIHWAEWRRAAGEAPVPTPIMG